MSVTEKQLKRIKEIQLSILEEIDVFCRKNDIQYSLAYGTLLGAVRHGGYIPWDDDVDIWMKRSDFDKFRHTFKSKNNKFCSASDTENYPFYMAKVINQNTTLIESANENGKFRCGVYIDIFVLERLPKNKIKRELKLARNYFLYVLFRFKYITSENKLVKNIQRHINPYTIEKKQKNLWKKSDGNLFKDNTALFFFNKNKDNRRYIYSMDIMDKVIDMKFDNLTCKVFEKYPQILKKLYGDYMVIPPENERITHSYVKFEEKYD